MPECHDCGCELPDGGHDYKVGEKLLYKCPVCFKKDPILRNHQKCEVYSRIVGYLRPISQWNPGKLAEWEKRKVYGVPRA